MNKLLYRKFINEIKKRDMNLDNYLKEIGCTKSNLHQQITDERLSLSYCIKIKKIFNIDLIELAINCENEMDDIFI